MGGGIAAFIAVKNNKGRRRAKVMVNNADVENNEKPIDFFKNSLFSKTRFETKAGFVC